MRPWANYDEAGDHVSLVLDPPRHQGFGRLDIEIPRPVSGEHRHVLQGMEASHRAYLHEQARESGQRLAQLEQRLGALPEAIRAQVRSASVFELADIGRRIPGAAGLEDIFGRRRRWVPSSNR